jgi:two-component system chemotaxis response regulator CheY
MSKTILLVDDSAAVRSFLKARLAWSGFELHEAEDGERALRLVQLIHVDLVIADIRMPGLDGLSFLRRLRASPRARSKDTPVILMTSSTSDQIEAEVRDAGANAFIRKPITAEQLDREIQRLLPGTVPPPSP